MIVKGKIPHEDGVLDSWFKGIKYDDAKCGETTAKNFPATARFVEKLSDDEVARLKQGLDVQKRPTREKSSGGCCSSRPK